MNKQIRKNKVNIALLICLCILIFLSTLPYFNIFFSPQLILLMAISLIISILGFSSRYIFGIAFLIILSAVFALLFVNSLVAEKIAFYGYTILVLGFFRSIYRNIYKNEKVN